MNIDIHQTNAKNILYASSVCLYLCVCEREQYVYKLQGSCWSCDALTLFAVCQWSCSPPEDRNKGRRQDREGSSAYLRQHSLCLSITQKHSTANKTLSGIMHHTFTCSHEHKNEKWVMIYLYVLYFLRSILFAVLDVK